MKKYYPNKTALKMLKILFFLVALILTCVAKLYLSVYPMIMFLVIGLFWTLFVLVALISLPIFFSKTYYFVSTNEVAKQSGIFFESNQLMRVSSIQYISTVATPLSKYTGFNFIKLNALGGYLVLLFLSKSDADDMTATISASLRKN